VYVPPPVYSDECVCLPTAYGHYRADERILDNGKDVCRKMDARQKNTCVKGEQKGYYPVGPLCGSGGDSVHVVESS
jgi:hypothetical protein